MILRIIAAWLREFDYATEHDVDRFSLQSWVNDNFHLTDEPLELAVDALIAAGIGRDPEQTQTVYCTLTGAACDNTRL